MPIDYSKYPKDWKSVIRPRILKLAGNRCEGCGVKNGEIIFRGTIYDDGIEVYQTANGNIYSAHNSRLLYRENFTIPVEPISGDPEQKAIKVILTVSHQDHDISNNDDSNLKALCQKCHLRHDRVLHLMSRKYGKNHRNGQTSLI